MVRILQISRYVHFHGGRINQVHLGKFTIECIDRRPTKLNHLLIVCGDRRVYFCSWRNPTSTARKACDAAPGHYFVLEAAWPS